MPYSACEGLNNTMPFSDTLGNLTHYKYWGKW